MKRTALIMFAFLFFLTGCANAENNNEKTTTPTETLKPTASADNPQTTDTRQESEETENIIEKNDAQASVPQDAEGDALPSDFEILTEPPALTVSTLNHADSVIASCGSFHWSHALPDGTSTEMLACGAHPLDWQEHPILYTAFPAGTLPPLEEGAFTGSILPVIYLDFGEILPETVSAIRWPASYIGDTQSYSTEFETVPAEFDGDMITLLPLGDGDFVYEISADWENMGGASYTFRTLPQVRESRKDEQTGIFDMLNGLEYQPYTCDGLPEYHLTAADGTMYAINFSDKWVWRGNNEQAELPDELIALLRESAGL